MGKFDNHGLRTIIKAIKQEQTNNTLDNVTDFNINVIPMHELNHTRYYVGIAQQPLAYEPIRTNRFVVEFPEVFGIDIASVRKTTMPSWSLESGWDDIHVTFYEFISPSISQILFHNLVALEDMRQFDMSISMLDPTGVVIRKWTINVGNVISIDFGGISNYGDEGIGEIILKLRINTCVLNF